MDGCASIKAVQNRSSNSHSERRTTKDKNNLLESIAERHSSRTQEYYSRKC